jgi:hypothetical protein
VIESPPPSLLDRGVHYLHLHPWGWLGVFASVALAGAAWLAAPVTWRHGEGDVVSDGKRTAALFRWVCRLFFWFT